METRRRNVVVGVDEAGRGAFFSRIYSAVVVANPELMEELQQQKLVVRDSKKMTPRQRNQTYDYLLQHSLYGIGYCDEKEIDQYGITKCNVWCMHRALDQLVSQHPDLVIEKILVDGVLFSPWREVPFELVVRGEDQHPEIAMASIVAKTSRDRFLLELCEKFPELDEKYHIKNNKGYGTVQHRKGLQEHGKHDFHRQSFIHAYTKHHLQFLT